MGQPVSQMGQLEEVAHVLSEDAQMRDRARADQPLVHIGLPGQFLDMRVGAHRDEALAPLVVAIPEILHQPQDPEDAAVRAHEAAARIAQRARVAGGAELLRRLGGQLAASHREIGRAHV